MSQRTTPSYFASWRHSVFRLVIKVDNRPPISTPSQLTAHLQERIASLVRIVRDQKLDHVVMPLMAADHAWSARYLYAPAAHVFLNSNLCVSATEVWVESARRAWRDEDPPERVATGRLKLRDIMPIDYMPVREIELPAAFPEPP